MAIAGGTQMELRDNNPLAERHIRYGGQGGIAYPHISATYIALFSNFIACGLREAVYILDGLLKNSAIFDVDTVPADTQGQSEPVFGLAHLLGIKLLLRMRAWNDAAFYRPSRETKYQPIDVLFTDAINWEVSETQWSETPEDLVLHIIVDNYSTHKHKKVKNWLKRNKRVTLHFIPTSSSWLNLVERSFGLITDKAIRRGVFTSVKDLEQKLMDFINAHNVNPQPFVWAKSVEVILEKVARAENALV